MDEATTELIETIKTTLTEAYRDDDRDYIDEPLLLVINGERQGAMISCVGMDLRNPNVFRSVLQNALQLTGAYAYIFVTHYNTYVMQHDSPESMRKAELLASGAMTMRDLPMDDVTRIEAVLISENHKEPTAWMAKIKNAVGGKEYLGEWECRDAKAVVRNPYIIKEW